MSGGIVTSSSDVRERDLRLVLDIVHEGHADDPGLAMPWSVLDGLARLTGSETVSFAEQDYRQQAHVISQDLSGGERLFSATDEPDVGDDVFWSAFWGSYCSYPQRTGDLTSIIHEEDFGSVGDRRRQPLWVDSLWRGGVHHCLIVSLPASPGQTRRLLLQRGPGGGFTERERQVVSLLRPHLYEIWLAAERKRAGAPKLTLREWEVLRLSGAGHSNAEIAQRLFLSPGTVRKHMEHIMERLNVHSRAAAAAIALPHAPMVLDLL